MSLRSVIKLAEWTIGPDRSEGASSPIRRVECRQCSARSQSSTVQADTDQWAMHHAGRTSHTSYRETTTALLRVVPAEDKRRGRTS